MLRHAEATPWRACRVDTRTSQALMAINTVVYTSVADKRIRNIWGK
jgi:hypothetical protein